MQTEPTQDTQLNVPISVKLKTWLGHLKAETGKTYRELAEDFLTFFYWLTTNIEDDEQAREFAQTQQRILNLYTKGDAEALKRRHQLRTLLEMNGTEVEP